MASPEQAEAVDIEPETEEGLLERLFAEHGLYDPSGDPFAEQRDNVDAPIKRLFTVYGTRYRQNVAQGLTTGILARFIDLLPPIILGIAIDAVFLQERAFDLWLVPQAWLPTSRIGQFWLSAGLIAAAFLSAALFNWVRGRAFDRFAHDVQNDLRTETYDRLQRLELAFFDEHETGELMSILSSNVNDLDNFLKNALDEMLKLVVTVGGVTLILLVINWQLAIVTLAMMPVIAAFTWVYVRTIEPRYRAVRQSLAEMYSRLENNLSGIQVIKSSNTEGYEHERVSSSSDEYRDWNWYVSQLSTVFFPSQQALTGLAFVLTFVVGGWWIFAGPPLFFTGTLTVGEFVSFILLAQRLNGPMARFGDVIDNYQRTRASAERVFGLMDETRLLDADKPGARSLTDVDGRVEYEDVTFGYREEPVLHDVTFRAEPGQLMALAGPSGSGKSTVVKLLPRLYEPASGEIRIDGTPIGEYTKASLRQALGYVGQHPFMFSGTVKANMAYGTDADEEEIVRAAKIANAHSFITNLEDGYETEIGQRGGRLSGGQRQRLSIARALLQDPDILVLDEATSAVDTETELLIQKALERVTEGRTTFSIAHRLSTIRDADQILVMEEGRIVERGTHDELIDTEGLYAHLWEVQMGEYDHVPPEFIRRAEQNTAKKGAAARTRRSESDGRSHGAA